MKKYKTIDEQIEYLRLYKKIIVNEEDRHIFEESNYISIINPYKEFFSEGKKADGETHIYKSETNFKELYKLVLLDKQFSKYLYSAVGDFERKFKSIMFHEICALYNEACPPSLEKDEFCILYIKEIEEFLKGDKELPRFCSNYFYQLTKKGFIYDKFGIESKCNLLLKIKMLGNNTKDTLKNSLITHYVKKQGIAPLWTIPNALTLGELNILYSMLNLKVQKKILHRMKFTDVHYEKIRVKDIFDFLGDLEDIRGIRNTVNHYEPIITFLISEMKNKKITDSRMYKSIQLVCINQPKFELDNINMPIQTLKNNPLNKRKIEIINMILNGTFKK